MNLDHIKVGENPPNDVNAIIEIPLGGNPVKYEVDKKSGAMYVDRFLHTAMFYPSNYGFLPHTLSADGDPSDIMVAVPVDKLHPFYSDIASYRQLPTILLDQISHFFEHYKDLEKGKWVKVVRWGETEEACRLILEAIERAKGK